jgi:hypothetical protein
MRFVTCHADGFAGRPLSHDGGKRMEEMSESEVAGRRVQQSTQASRAPQRYRHVRG